MLKQPLVLEDLHNQMTLKTFLLSNHRQAIYQFLKPQMGGFIDKESIGLSILNSQIEENKLKVKTAIFYEEKVGGCNCLDDPYSENGYCEVLLTLDRQANLNFF